MALLTLPTARHRAAGCEAPTRDDRGIVASRTGRSAGDAEIGTDFGPTGATPDRARRVAGDYRVRCRRILADLIVLAVIVALPVAVLIYPWLT